MKNIYAVILWIAMVCFLTVGIANSQDLDFSGAYVVKGTGKYVELNDPKNKFQFTNIQKGMDSLNVVNMNIGGCTEPTVLVNYPQCKISLVLNGGTIVDFNPPVFWNKTSGIFTGVGTTPCIVGPCNGTDPNLSYVINGTFNIKNNKVTKITGSLYVPYLEDNVFGYINYSFTATR